MLKYKRLAPPAQPPGVPEICKKSLNSCPAEGGLELYILGKNFLKDTRVLFQARRSTSPTHHHHTTDDYDIVWEESVVPDKEYLQQVGHLCPMPKENFVFNLCYFLFRSTDSSGLHRSRLRQSGHRRSGRRPAPGHLQRQAQRTAPIHVHSVRCPHATDGRHDARRWFAAIVVVVVEHNRWPGWWSTLSDAESAGRRIGCPR